MGQCKRNKNNVIKPVLYILNLTRNHPEKYDGFSMVIDGKIEALSIWERPISRDLPANSYISITSHNIPGLSEWANVLMCEILSEKNIQEVNLGGSETRNLDRFKRKFSPVKSIMLSTLKFKK